MSEIHDPQTLSPADASSVSIAPSLQDNPLGSTSSKVAIASAHDVPVLMYHHVNPHRGMINSSPENFERQISALARAGYTSLSAAEFAAFLSGAPVPRKSVLITFDDGYLDNWLYAHPVLARYNMRAVLFTVTGWIGDGAPRAHAGQTTALAETYAHKVGRGIIESGDTDRVMARWSELEAMQAAGTFEIHSHTHTHTRWDYVCRHSNTEKIERLSNDLELSRDLLRSKLGINSGHLCWPQGYFDSDYLDVARKNNFTHLYTTAAFGQNKVGTDPEHIYRFAISNMNGLRLLNRVRMARGAVVGPAYNAFKLWKRKLRGKDLAH